MTATRAGKHHASYVSAVEQADGLRQRLRGARVRYVGMTGRTDGPTGRIVKVKLDALVVKWDGQAAGEDVHPDHVEYLR